MKHLLSLNVEKNIFCNLKFLYTLHTIYLLDISLYLAAIFTAAMVHAFDPGGQALQFPLLIPLPQIKIPISR
jgi:hypothetical protein